MNKSSVPKIEPELQNHDGEAPATYKENETFNDFDDQFNTWLNEAGGNVTGGEFRVFVKRVKPDNSIKHLETYKNRFPSLDEIGAKWGGGKYQFGYNLLVPRSVSKNGKIGTNTTVEIDESWNEVAKQNREEERRQRLGGDQADGGDLGAIGSGNNPFGQAVALSQAIISMVKQIMETNADRAPAAPTDMFKALNSMAEEMVRSNLKTLYGIRNQAIRELPFDRREIAGGNMPTLAPAPAENPLVSVIGSVIDEYAPKILGGGMIADQAVEFIKGMIPRFETVTHDPAAMQLIVNTCCNKYGIEKTKDLFSKIGIPLQ